MKKTRLLGDQKSPYPKTWGAQTSTKEVRSIINKQDDRFNESYDSSIYHDLDYIRLALYALTREIENGGLKQSNLESWYNCTQRICRHQEANTATRNNRKRNATQKRSMKRRGDW
ncbi:1577_t:CDS:2 [Funneliformis mosseae]|uniref:1577_t:CDS:1 n=1 Tax=Funneliformis mosseae TaxID=27381 RepID=A0A9N9BD09_FUNMO|nr:1577_t:CDS:2 [Funneliformis mosseae]